MAGQPNNNGTGSPKASAAAHLNVYKPTFIINNSFQNEMNQEEGMQRPPTNEHKKYSRGQAKSGQSQQPSSMSHAAPVTTSGIHHGKLGTN